ncbi:hypothetical protein CH263_06375 [Rhodococcus sp. 06-1059B-a]|nr:hypothetical protein [Rhodococcus sp. 06-1059B-a]OZD70540.1 hypothetical protein CH263_06375 [Rhodococcus sp. 06-1059B-a]
MDTSRSAAVSARDRARKANAQRLADAQSRLKSQEQDLVLYFDATRDEEKVEEDLGRRIARLQRDARAKLESARSRRAEALAALKSRGETYSSIAGLVGLPVPEATKLVKVAVAARVSGQSDGSQKSSDTAEPIDSELSASSIEPRDAPPASANSTESVTVA